ncbi:glutamate-rich protein 2 isoform X1 [Panthera pardus]|uniref:Glutamate-rich protein 2 isoform X1 n=2 Tax=Panthera pardus TaxID=9691 RepID=A0A9W2VYQ2_PANPR|nr:glutamate-rich protein 2 isoform X1 [Panthera pardus]
MDNDIPISLLSSLLKVTSAPPDVCSRLHASYSQRDATAGLSITRVSRPASFVIPRACSAHVPPPPCPSAPPYVRSAPLPGPGLAQLPQPGLAGLAGSRPVPPSPARSLHSSPGAARLLPGPQWLPQLVPPSPLSFRFPEPQPGLRQRAVSSPWRRRVYSSQLRTPREPRVGLAFGIRPEEGRCERTTGRFGLWGSTAAEAALEKVPKYRQNGRVLVFDPKAKVMLEPNEAMSDKCLFGRRPRLASKLCTSPTQVSLNVARTISEKKEVSSKNVENTASLRNTENRASSKNIENKDTEINLQSKLWSSSFLKESIGQVGKDAVLQEQEKNNKRCLQDIDDKLSESTDDDGEDDTSDDDNDEDSHPNKDTHAPLELMAEFLRAEMGQDYHLAKKLCQMILIYEPENPEAKEFFSLIEEMLLMEKSQNLEEDDEDSEEDSSSESEGESSEELSEESSDECEDG